ncbi:hypothetical protein JVU11DRAFT_67 [Chiua virens]|nr:hypothetical protein JVU11DRAFT_67 [Chiua virens]
MSSPIHVVHTIHGTFSGIHSYSRLPSYSTYAGVAMDMPDRQPPGLAKAVWRAVPIAIPPSCRRLPPPLNVRRHTPPLRTTTAQPVCFPQEDNPFSDRHALPAHPAAPISTVQNNQVVPYQRTRLASQSFTVKMPRPSHLDALVRQRTAQRLALDREARCKAVAGILLNRVHAVGKPMRRAPPNLDTPRTYKRSRLSTMVTVDDL